MTATLELGDVKVDVILKDIKNVHLSVHPPTGRVRIAAPQRMQMEQIRLFAISKLGWIRTQQRKLSEQERETPREFLERESHYVWGKRYLLEIREQPAPAKVELHHRKLIIHVRPETTSKKAEQIHEAWLRDQVRQRLPGLQAKWEPIIGVSVAKWQVRRMKTKWGSCNTQTRVILLNTELAKKPPQCLEYIVVHEMVHLLERTHNARFRSYMDKFYPTWPEVRSELNRAPLAHIDWKY